MESGGGTLPYWNRERGMRLDRAMKFYSGNIPGEPLRLQHEDAQRVGVVVPSLRVDLLVKPHRVEPVRRNLESGVAF